MKHDLKNLLEPLLKKHLGSTASLASAKNVAGGCINDARLVSLTDGQNLFIKSNDTAAGDLFAAEANGLRLLGSGNQIRVPEVLFVDQFSNGTPCLAIEFIEPGRIGPGFSERFGIQLAALHRFHRGPSFGLDHSNYLGSTRQPNGQSEDWPAFFGEQRIGFQLELAVKNGRVDSKFIALGNRLIERLPKLLPTHGTPSLIHGDLWSGNYLCDQSGNPVLIDPAVYFADREAEFGMTILFGGFDQRFYDSYLDAWPLEDGYSERFEIYKLYHLLNHLNLFGDAYLGGCLSILSKFA